MTLTRPAVRYAPIGDDRIAYQVLGTGPADLILLHGTIAHLDWMWELPQEAQKLEDLASFCRLMLFDRRGSGLSDRLARVLTPDERVDDIRAVMDAAKSERAYVFGMSEGATLALLFAALRPERTLGLILWGGRPRWIRAPDYPWGRTEDEVERSLEQRAKEEVPPIDPEQPEWKRWLGSSATDPSVVEWFNRMRRSGLSPADGVRVGRMNMMLDVRPLLPTIKAPTLIFARDDDPVAPLDLVRDMASRIPQAKMTVFRGQGHAFFDIWPEMNAAIREFMTGEVSPPRTDRELATLVFTDLVGSTEIAARVGDAAWRALLERYYAIARRNLAGFGGSEVDSAGDGMFARFDGPAKALWFAKAVRRAAGDLGLRVRSGIHIGEVERSGPHFRGLAVVIGSRIAARADADEVLVSGTVRDLLYGAGIGFQDRGTADLKGIPEPQRIYAVE